EQPFQPLQLEGRLEDPVDHEMLEAVADMMRYQHPQRRVGVGEMRIVVIVEWVKFGYIIGIEHDCAREASHERPRRLGLPNAKRLIDDDDHGNLSLFVGSFFAPRGEKRTDKE